MKPEESCFSNVREKACVVSHVTVGQRAPEALNPAPVVSHARIMQGSQASGLVSSTLSSVDMSGLDSESSRNIFKRTPLYNPTRSKLSHQVTAQSCLVETCS